MHSLIKEIIKAKPQSREDLMMLKRQLAKKYKNEVLRNSDIIKFYQAAVASGQIKASDVFEKLIRKRTVRTMSGIAPVAVLTKPFACPAKCVYCPTVVDVPKSYLPNEPAVMRAILCKYDPYKQVQMRLQSLENNGHKPTKIEIIVIGGTWSVLPEQYKYWYLANVYKAANDYKKIKNYKLKIINSNTKKDGSLKNSLDLKSLKKILKQEQARNEKAKYKIIGLTLETRPDYIDDVELTQMRVLGCTRVELGVQAVDDKILKLNKRGHGVAEIARATELLKNYGFKITYHIMPGLPGSSAKKDLQMFGQLFSDPRFQPDQIKFYPTVVVAGSELYDWWKAGKYKPYSDKVLQKLIIDCKKLIPHYVRVIRLIRDIPAESIVAGNIITNLRQIMQAQGLVCHCIRCREAKEVELKIKNLKLKIIEYKASGGKEYFIQYVDKKDTLYGFLRLRIPGTGETGVVPAALIREVHVYGELVSEGDKKKVQHAGLGKKLMQAAEKIVKKNKLHKIMVISGVGARGYYQKLGYKLEEEYMIKNF